MPATMILKANNTFSIDVTISDGNIYMAIRVPFDLIYAEEKIGVNVLECKKVEFKLVSDKPSGYEYRVEGAGIASDKCAFIKVFADIPQNKISKKDREKILSVLRDVYGNSSSNTTVEPTSIND